MDIIELCKQYKEDSEYDEMEFFVIWEYIQNTDDLNKLELLRDIIPTGMLKYRLLEKIGA